MNHRILKLLRLLGAPLLAAAAVFGSCTTELESTTLPPDGGSGKGEQEVLLRLNVPGTTKPGEKGGTRAVDKGEEEEIDDLYILAFKAGAKDSDDTYEYWVPAKKGADNATWTALLKVKDYDQRFIVIANAMHANGGLLAAINALKPGEKTKEEIKELLTVTLTDDEKTSGFNAAGPNNHSAFTMCGQTPPTKIKADGNAELNVSLYRIMARISVYFGNKTGAGVNNFVPSTVRLYNFNDKAQVIPDELGGKVTKTTIPADAALQKGNAKYTVAGNKLEYSIYMFETAQPENTAADGHANRPCLVVGGKYNGGTDDKYYRVDLGTPKADTGNKELDYLDILRNHSYEITVTKVSGEGHDTEQEALESKSANMTATVIPWNETEIGNIDFDGEKFLGIGTMEYRVGKMGSDNLIQKVAASTGLEWRAALLNADGQGTPDWIRFVVDGGEQTNATGTGAGANAPADLKFKVTGKNAPGDRVAIMRFTAGHLQVDARVIQDDNNPVFIDIPDDVIEFDGATDVARSFDITFGPENTTLTWEVVDGNNPITFTVKSIDGIADGNTGVQSGTTARKQVAANFTAQTIAGDAKVKNTATLRLIAKNANGDITAKSVRLSQIKRTLNLSEDWIITDGKEHNIYVDANFDWSVTMENPDQIEGTFIESFTQSQTGAADMGATSDKSVVKLKTKTSTAFDKEEKMITLIFTDVTTGTPIKKTIKFVKGYTYNDAIYEVVYGGEKTLSQVHAQDKSLPNGVTLGPGFDYAPAGMCGRIAAQEQREVWHPTKAGDYVSTDDILIMDTKFYGKKATLYMQKVLNKDLELRNAGTYSTPQGISANHTIHELLVQWNYHAVFAYTRTCLIVFKEKFDFCDEYQGNYGAIATAQGGTTLPKIEALRDIWVKPLGYEVAFANIHGYKLVKDEVDVNMPMYKDFIIIWDTSGQPNYLEYKTWNGQLKNPFYVRYKHSKPNPDVQKHVYFAKKIEKN